MSNDLIAKSAMDRRMAEIITPVIEDMGFELVRVRLMGGKTNTLQIMADKPDGGIEVDDCAEISTALGALLDVEDPISDNYTMEVSSPGMDRILFKPAQFEASVGEKIEVRLNYPFEGRKRIVGVLAGLEDDEAIVQVDQEEYLLPLENVQRARIVPQFD